MIAEIYVNMDFSHARCTSTYNAVPLYSVLGSMLPKTLYNMHHDTTSCHPQSSCSSCCDSYYLTICKQLSECVNSKSRCGKRVFSRWPQWLAVIMVLVKFFHQFRSVSFVHVI